MPIIEQLNKQNQPPEVLYKKCCLKIFLQYLQENTFAEVSFETRLK